MPIKETDKMTPPASVQYCTYTFIEHDSNDAIHAEFIDKRQVVLKSPKVEVKGFKAGLAAVEAKGVAVKDNCGEKCLTPTEKCQIGGGGGSSTPSPAFPTTIHQTWMRLPWKPLEPTLTEEQQWS